MKALRFLVEIEVTMRMEVTLGALLVTLAC